MLMLAAACCCCCLLLLHVAAADVAAAVVAADAAATATAAAAAAAATAWYVWYAFCRAHRACRELLAVSLSCLAALRHANTFKCMALRGLTRPPRAL